MAPPPEARGAAAPSAAAAPRLRRNLLLLYSGEGGAKLLGLVAFGLLGHALGNERYGDLEFAIAIFFVLNLVMEAGLGPYGAREAARHPESTDRLAGRIVALRALLLVASLVLLVGVAFLPAHSEERRRLVLCYAAALVPAPFLMNWAFQARDRMSVVAAGTFLRQLGVFLVALLLVRGPEDAAAVPLADAAGLAAVVVLQQVLFRRGGGRIERISSAAELRAVARESWPIAGSTLAWAGRVFAPTLALGFFATSADTGVYGAAHRLVVALHTFAWLYFFNLLPSLSRGALEPGRAAWRRLVRLSAAGVAWIVLPGCMALVLLADELLPRVFGSEFVASAPVFRIAVWMPAVAFLSGHQRYSLIAFGRVRAELGASLVGLFVGVAGALGLASSGRLDPTSAAWTLLAAELATLVTAHVALTRCVERLPLLPALAGPAAALGLGLALWRWLAPGSGTAGAALVLAAALAGLLALRPHLLGQLVRDLRGARPGG